MQQASDAAQPRSPAGQVALTLAGERLLLCPERAVHWPNEAAVLIADPHFGKAACFRRAGVPVPRGTTRDDLARLTKLLERTGASELIVLGDFWHGPASHEPEVLRELAAWRRQHAALQVTLVPGNHDRRAGPPPTTLAITETGDSIRRTPFILQHEPAEAGGCHESTRGRRGRRFADHAGDGHRPDDPDPADRGRPFRARGPILAGHVHPALRLTDAGVSFRLPCFHLTDQGLTLPAFGGFTGMHTLQPAAGDRLIPIIDHQVIG